ncbi:MdtL family multidrug efflux MFS transporter [Ferrimonas sp. YFM]|uniref:MdtL family multidrug efflux MFS transporter n=1 Tax=Ferrimonas sp. YFM TaxID=3028878 RepID=UPI002573ABC1|nr:MdtL family multidrug efflux MFS transporter [Ferrimonas sp. YFM]BDY04455.1 multidrug resistance protein MdtL [Ferrimonas sp. YFM]
MNPMLLCCFALVLLYPLGVDLYLIAVPDISADLGASSAQLHYAFSLYLAGMASTMILGGILADRLGRRPVALWGAALFLIASLLAMMSDTTLQFLLARFGQGVGAGFAYVTCFAVMRDTLDDGKRTRIMSMINGIICILPVTAPVLGHFILLHHPWRVLFLLMATLATTIFLLCLKRLPETRPGQQITPSSPRQLFGHPLFVSRLIIGTLATAVILSFVENSPLILITELGISKGEYSLVMSSTALISMTSAFMTPKLLRLWGESRVLSLAQGMFLVAGVLLAAPHNALSLYLGFAAICSGFSMGFGIATSQALSPCRESAGLASSVLGVSQVAGSACYIWVMGLIGTPPMVNLLAILFVAGVINLILIHRTRSATHLELSRDTA